MIDIERNKGVQYADWLEVDDPIFGQTQQLDRGQLVDRKVVDVLENIQVYVAEHQTLYSLHPALGVPEHRAFYYQAPLQLSRLTAAAIDELRAKQKIELAAG